jgi:hypothetical protein
VCAETLADVRLYYLALGEAPTLKGKTMQKKQKVARVADEVLERQARITREEPLTRSR